MLCSFGGQLVHGGSVIGENLIKDKDLVKSFGNLIQCECNNLIVYMNFNDISIGSHKELRNLYFHWPLKTHLGH